MKKIDVEFLNEYLPVEKICNEIYGENGVTAYINDMQYRTDYEKRLVYNWDAEFKKLKHLRWLRNQIVHPNNSYEVTQQDLIDIRIFHNKLLKQQDPLALLRKEIAKANKEQRELKLQLKNSQKKTQQPSYDNKENDNSEIIILSLVAVAIVVIFAIAYMFFFR